MFDENEVQTFKKGGKSGEKPDKAAPFNWKSLPIDLLILYRDQITRELPPLALKDMNMEEELLLQFHNLRALQNQVLNDDTLPLNQRAQVANSVANVLENLTSRQEKIYSSERFKLIENLLIRHLNLLPEATAEAFIVEYERILGISSAPTE